MCRDNALATLPLVLGRGQFAFAHPLRLGLGTLAALLGGQLVLAPYQGRQRIMAALAQVIQAGRHAEALLALGLLARKALLDRSPLGGDLGTRRRLGPGGHRDEQQDES